MKKIHYLIIVLFLPFISIPLFAQTPSQEYYYYKGEKKYLEKNPEYLFILYKNTNELRRFISSESLKFSKQGVDNFQNNSTQKLSNFNNMDTVLWAEISLERNNLEYTNSKKDELKNHKDIEVVSPYYKTKDSKKLGLSNYFYVKLFNLKDTMALFDFAGKNNVKIVQQNEYMPLWFTLSVTSKSSKNALELANLFFESKLFQFAEPDLMVENLAMDGTLINYSNNQFYNDQWNLNNIGQYGGNLNIDINAPEAWDISTGNNVIVAVLDHGIELNHPDLQANIYPLSFDTETNTSPSVVRGEHGTTCAGIIGAVGNAVGIKGVAPNAQLMSLSNSLYTNVNSRTQLANGINWAVNNGAQVISNSWGHNDLKSSLIDEAIINALNNGRGGLGCVVVFASGNNNSNVIYPANSNPNILAVGAISMCGERKRSSSNLSQVRWDVVPDPQGVSCDTEILWGSNYGNELDIVAPGVLIPTTDLVNTRGYNPYTPIHPGSGGTKINSDYSDNNYTVWFNGTSSACPHVAGVAALILSIKPNLTGAEVRNIIERTAQKTGTYNYSATSGRNNGTWNNEMGYGLLNAHAAVVATNNIGGCSAITNYINQTVSSTITVTGCNINVNNVNVNSGGRLILQASEATTIQSQFEVKAGGKLEIYKQ